MQTMKKYMTKNLCAISAKCQYSSQSIFTVLFYNKTKKILKYEAKRCLVFLAYSSLCVIFTFEVCVLSELSVAKPLPQMLQWKGRFLARSTCAS